MFCCSLPNYIKSVHKTKFTIHVELYCIYFSGIHCGNFIYLHPWFGVSFVFFLCAILFIMNLIYIGRCSSTKSIESQNSHYIPDSQCKSIKSASTTAHSEQIVADIESNVDGNKETNVRSIAAAAAANRAKSQTLQTISQQTPSVYTSKFMFFPIENVIFIAWVLILCGARYICMILSVLLRTLRELTKTQSKWTQEEISTKRIETRSDGIASGNI